MVGKTGPRQFFLFLDVGMMSMGITLKRTFQTCSFSSGLFKDIYFVIYGSISEFTDKGQFHYLTKLKGPQVGKYLYTTQFLLLR